MPLPFSYTIVRTKRKTVQIQVTPSGDVLVRGPRTLRRAQAEAVLEQHCGWVTQQIARQRTRNAQRRAISDAEAQELTAQAQRVLPELTAHWAARMGVQPAGVRITKAAARWGSCSAQNRICYSFRVMLLPAPLREYIVVHELSHIRQKNHGPAFYAEGTRFLPDFAQRRQALRVWERHNPLGGPDE